MTDEEQAYTKTAPLVILTPDDIITLRLLRDDFGRIRFLAPHDPNRCLKDYTGQVKLLETLERILKQVG